MTITINGKKVTVDQNILTYQDIVEMVKGRPGLYSVMYDRLKRCDCSGILGPNDSVLVSEGMSISACITDNA